MNGMPYTPPGGPPDVPRPSPEIYKAMGEENIFKMLRAFYEQLEKSEIREMFTEDMQAASEKSAKFFVSLLGGPPLYQKEYGPPRMRARHFPFAIDEKARQVWLACFDKTLENAAADFAFPEEHLEGFKTFLSGFSGWMVNRQSE